MSLKQGQYLNQADFSGGINISNPGHLIADTECVAGIQSYDGTRNCYWDSGIRKRLGTLKVNTYPGIDLMKDGNCEATDNPILTSETTCQAVENGTWARSSAQKNAGSYSWLLTKSTGDAIAFLCDSKLTNDLHTLIASHTYYVEAYLYSDVATASNVTLNVDEYYGAAWHNNKYTLTAKNAWTKASFTFTANASTAAFVIYVKAATAEASGKLVYVDDVKIIDVAEKIVNGIRFYRSTSPKITTFVAANYCDATKICYLDSSDNLINVTGGTAFATDADVFFAKWKDTLYVVGGTTGNGVIQKITESSGWSRANITGNTAKPQYIVHHRDRLWAAGGDMAEGTIECSDYDDDTSWSAGDGEVFNVGYKDGDPITAMVPLGDNLVIYKNDSIWMMQGDNLFNWFQKKQEEAFGCVAPKSAVDVGIGHIFLSADNIYIFDGETLAPIGTKIKPWLDLIPTTLRSHCAATLFNGYYRLSFPSSSRSTYNDLEVILDLKYLKGGKISWWLNDGRNIAAYIPCDGPNDTNIITICDDNAGYVRQIEIGSQDDGSDFTMEFHSRYFIFEQPNITKMYDRLKIDCSQGIGYLYLTILKNLNDEYSLPITIDLTGSGSTFGSAVLDTSYWTSQSNTRTTTEIALPSELDGNALSYKVVHNSDDAGVVFYGFSINYKLRSF